MIYPWNIIGHEFQLTQLEKGLSQENLTHAYLFHGPRDIGKHSIAMTMARILLCSNNLCHQCQDCRQVEAGIHPDLIILKDDGATIKIDDVRALIQKTNLTSQGKRRVVLIENLERMPTEAQNSFLKTLEEPPGDTVFLITVNQIKRVLPTILSRVRQISLSLISDEVMKPVLMSRFEGNPNFEEVLQMAQGRPGLAIRLLSDSVLFAAYKAMYLQIDNFLLLNNLNDKFTYVEGLDKEPGKMELFFDICGFTIRKAAHDFVAGKQHPLKDRYDLRGLTDLFEKLVETRYLTTRNVNKKLALENFFLLTEK